MSLADGIEGDQAVKHLKSKYFNSSIKLLKVFEKMHIKLGLLLQPISIFCIFLREILILVKIMQIFL